MTIRHLSRIAGLMLAYFLGAGCQNQPSPGSVTSGAVQISKVPWGQVDGKQVYLFTLTNVHGMEVKISNYGGTITSWEVPGPGGKKSDVVLGFDSLKGYLAKPPYFGATVGRYANRIARGRFTIGKAQYTLAKNNGPNHLHGGLKGFDKVVWDASVADDSTAALTLDYTSPDGEEGYPGNLHARVRFTLLPDDELDIEYFAQTDKPTPVNLTNHSYFNLSGDASRSILKETLQLAAAHYTPVDSTLIPTGQILPVAGTPFDFTQPREIGERMALVPGGYDHNFVLNAKDSTVQVAAVVTDPETHIRLTILTTEPGIQFYTGNFLDGTIKNRDGKAIPKNGALCLEPQHFPNSPNEPRFPSTILRPDDKYHSFSRYRMTLVP